MLPCNTVKTNLCFHSTANLCHLIILNLGEWYLCTVRGSNPGGGARFLAPVQTGPGTHPTSCTMGTGSFPGVKNSWGVTLTPHALLVPWSRKSRAIPLLPLWAVQPVQSLSACTRVHVTFFFFPPPLFNILSSLWKIRVEVKKKSELIQLRICAFIKVDWKVIITSVKVDDNC